MGTERPRAPGVNPAASTSRTPRGSRANAFLNTLNNATGHLGWLTVENDPREASQAEYKKQAWGPVRVVNCWPLFLFEQGRAICLWHKASPRHGYKLAADWAQHFDSRFGNGLNGPSRGKLDELVRFMFTVEALEDESAP
jgi:hypothetical protein